MLQKLQTDTKKQPGRYTVVSSWKQEMLCIGSSNEHESIDNKLLVCQALESLESMVVEGSDKLDVKNKEQVGLKDLVVHNVVMSHWAVF